MLFLKSLWTVQINFDLRYILRKKRSFDGRNAKRSLKNNCRRPKITTTDVLHIYKPMGFKKYN